MDAAVKEYLNDITDSQFLSEWLRTIDESEDEQAATEHLVACAEAVRDEAQAFVEKFGRTPVGLKRPLAAFDITTYNGNLDEAELQAKGLEEYGKPMVPVTVTNEDGVRINMGTGTEDLGAPSVLIEKQPDRWAIFVSTDVGGDNDLLVYIMLDKASRRVVVVPEGQGCGRLVESDLGIVEIRNHVPNPLPADDREEP